ncbi:hypothetical protein L6R52_39810, partial [Myxococcota bacterium]|nr:hypothetical protein [Myxococcota bacterium]
GPTQQAWVYPHDPLTGEPVQVTLPEPSEEAEGYLQNDWVAVSNCLNQPGGPTSTQDLGGFQLTISYCIEIPTALPDESGNYLHIEPPADPRDGNDPFAEVMMYHHVNVIHDYFHGTHGFRALDFPLPAVVNLQFKIDPPIPFLEVGPDGWSYFPNAAFFPKESWNQLAGSLGLPEREQDSIIFGQAAPDFSYDASVIYHEYTHAMIGSGKLNARLADRYGLDDAPRSLNEGLADYFAATKLEDPVVGRYGIGTLDPNLVRDLTVRHVCPDDLVAEVHADGKVIGSALWEVRSRLGAEVTDGIVFRAVQRMVPETNHDAAGELILDEARAASAMAEATVQSVFEEWGVVGCDRAKPWVAFDQETSDEKLPYPVEGTQSAGVPGFSQWVPGFFGFYVEVPAGKQAVTLSWSLAAGGGFGGFPGGGGSTPRLALSVRGGAPVELDYGIGVSRVEDAYFEPTSTASGSGGATQTVTLGPTCIPEGGGRIYLLFVNTQGSATNVDGMGLALLDEAPAPSPDVFECIPPT